MTDEPRLTTETAQPEITFDADPFDAYEAGVRMGWALAEAYHGLSTSPEQTR